MIAEPRTMPYRKTVRDMKEDDGGFFLRLSGAHEAMETVEPGYGERDEVWFECEIVHPKSSKGRTVSVHIPAEQVLAVLKMCRRAAAARRAAVLT